MEGGEACLLQGHHSACSTLQEYALRGSAFMHGMYKTRKLEPDMALERAAVPPSECICMQIRAYRYHHDEYRPESCINRAQTRWLFMQNGPADYSEEAVRAWLPTPVSGYHGKQHRLSDISADHREAVCAQCGRVDVVGKKRLSCGPERRMRQTIERTGRAPNKPEGSWENRKDSIAAQGGRCLICEDRLTPQTARWDHDHISGEFRGYLCNRCNCGLGSFKDNTEFLERAIRYLRGETL